ncbi:MAG: glycosyltransferase family 2 protein, partial [Acidobacteriota bacterium]|nr:glycosyltransferase family 2 protein [Acidobacteriota bacterium]
LLRLMRPVIESSENPVVSAGVVRIRNGCEAVGGRIRRIGLPRRWIEMLQVVEYLRNFLLGRAGWGPLGGTLIVSGAMAVFERQTVVDAGGFDARMVSEDMELIVRLHHRATEKKRQTKMAFTPETVCWTECPKTVAMLARQRRRWHLGLCQSLHSHLGMNFNPRFGIVGVFSFPFHLFVEGLGAAVELFGYLLVPLAFVLHVALISFYIPLVLLSLVYASLLSVGAVLAEELLAHRYPARSDLYSLLKWSLFENFGFRQLLLWFRFQGLLRFLGGARNWEKVAHSAGSAASSATGGSAGAEASA